MKIAIAVGMAYLSLCPLAAAAEPEPAALARQARTLLKTHCYRCHGQDGANEGGFNYVADLRQLVQRNKVRPGDVAHSRLYKRLTSADDPMPPAEEKLRPGKNDIALLKQWIEAGAPDADRAPARPPFLSSADMIRFIHDDLDRLRERDRRFTRYFTLTHLANAGLSADELQSYRHGLSKLVNSLSWGSRVVVPRPIDPGRTVFRIDLRDYQWNEKVWDAIVAEYPYGIDLDSEAARACATATGCRLPYVRGDWFVAVASRPPLYHEVLQLPATERELEKLLHVDTAEDVRQERVARAGFNGSGVSRNNRLIERHESAGVVYWKSYDFAGNTGLKNLFARPLGPGGDGGFEHDGGEIIFSLPNGLQGYFLVDGQGRRLDKGPVRIVSDPRRPDRAVENGLSCMSCHAKGLIEKADEVREHVLKNAAGFVAADVETVRVLYPPRDRFTALLRQDARRFQGAVAKTGAPLTATEPVAALAQHFEAELDLPLAAAEAGVPPEDLSRALERSPELAKELGPLRSGGTVQRQVFVAAYPDVVRTLRLGVVLGSKGRSQAGMLRLGDRLLDQKDTDGAVQTYTRVLEREPKNVLARIGRGDAYQARGDYDRAIADYDEALRLDPRSTTALVGRGQASARKGAFAEAVADFTAALQIDPASATAYHRRGAAYHARGDLDEAIADYTQALRLNPRLARAYLDRSRAFQKKGDARRAAADRAEALRLDPRLGKE